MGEVKYLGSKSLINTSLNACDSEQCPMLVFNSTQRCQNSSLGWPGEDDLKLGWVRRRLSLGFGLPAKEELARYLLSQLSLLSSY